MERARPRLFALFGALGFAVAQPLFDLIGRNPTFLVQHEAETPERLLLIVLSWLLPGLLLFVLIEGLRRLHERAAAWLHRLLIGALCGVALLPAFSRALPAFQSMASALAAALVVAVGLASWSWLRRLFAWSPWASVFFSALFLWQGLRPPPPREQVASARPIGDRSIFVLLLDELPVTNLLRAADEIDAELFPNFARFAEDAVWFRNAYTANAYTERSVPILLTGRVPRKGQRPTLEHHRPNVFTILDHTHRMVVSEKLTRLCPPELAMRRRLAAGERTRLLLADVALLWLHRALPYETLSGLPSVENRWFDYWGLRDDRQGPVDRLRRWLAEIQPSVRPLLGVIHLMYPHNPYTHHPDGERFALRSEEPFLERTHWIDDQWAADQAWHRSRLQLQHLDRLLGEFLDHLQGLGLYDDAVVAIVADHGASYRAGMPFRNPIDDNWIDMLAIPMFVKMPDGARAGEVDRRLLSSLDFLPTIFDAAFGSTRWPMHGISFARRETPGREWIEIHQPAADPPLRRIPGREIERQLESFARMRSTLSTAVGGSFGPNADMVGRSLAEFPIAEAAAGEIHLDAASDLEFDELTGSLETAQPQATFSDLALASSDRILAVTRSVHERPRTRVSEWVALLPQEHDLDGLDGLRFFAVEQQGEGERRLRPLAYAAGAPSLLDRRLGMGTTAHYAVSGFHDEFRDGGELCRWTDGRGLLRVPIRESQPARALRLELKASAPDGCELEILVAGRTLLRERIEAGAWSGEIPIPAELQSESTEIELRSDSFVPAERIEGSTDRRRLGILLRGLWLTSGQVDMP